MPPVADDAAPLETAVGDDGDPAEADARRVALDEDSPTNGLAELVLTLIKLLHDLLEKQAIRRMESGRLTDEEVERVGQTLKRQAEEIEHLCDVFGLDSGDLRLDLGTVHGLRDLDEEPGQK